MPKLMDAPTLYITAVEGQIKTKFLDEQKQTIFGKESTKSSRNAGYILDTFENLLQSTVANRSDIKTKLKSKSKEKSNLI